MQHRAERYGGVAMLFHWVMAALIVFAWYLGNGAEDLEGGPRLIQITLHKNIGSTVLALVALRLIWRLFRPAPPLPATMSPVMRGLATATHWALYLVMFGLPLSGWLLSSAAGYPVMLAGLLELPALVDKSEAIRDFARGAHGLMGNVILALVVLHVVAALKHHFVDRDDTLRRMLPRLR